MMGRAWLATALLVIGISTTAHAKQLMCACPQRQSWPELDATLVPTNQQAIEIEPWSDDQFKITSLGDIDPDSDYNKDTAPFFRFHTAKEPDLVPPRAPTDVHPSIALGADASVGSAYTSRLATISLWGNYDDTTQFLEVEVTQTNSRAHFGLLANQRYMCGFPLRNLAPGHAHIKVWAVDRTGNRSVDAWESDLALTLDNTLPADNECQESHHHVRCGMGEGLLFLLVVPAGFILLLIVLAIGSAIRRSRIKYSIGEHVSIPLGESVARIVAKTYVIKFFVSIGVIATLWQLEHEVVAIMLSPLAIVWFLDVLRAAAVVRWFNHPVNRLERKDDFLHVDHTLLYCGRRAWNRASRLPTATLPKR